jgi:hypothetical protein
MDLVDHLFLNNMGDCSLPVSWPVGLKPCECMLDPVEDEQTDGTTQMETIKL